MEGVAMEVEGLQDTRMCADEELLSCKICRNAYCKPRLLSCLHCFCEDCLNERLSHEPADSTYTIVCPECLQKTQVGSTGASSLPFDCTTTNILKSAEGNLFCTSCNSGLRPTSGCFDCAQYLCAYCHSAHQTMRCFNGHHVIDLTEDGIALDSIHLHRCQYHPSKRLELFCTTCEVLVCDHCALSDHKSHPVDCRRLEEVLPQQRNELETLVEETREKSGLCYNLSTSIENALNNLQQQCKSAEELVFETYKIYETILKKCRDERLQEIQTLRVERELKITGTTHDLKKFSEKLEDACKFTSKLLECGNAEEILSLKKVVATQLQNIISHMPQMDLNSNLQFGSTITAFENALQGVRKPISPIPKEILPDDSNSELNMQSFPMLKNVAPKYQDLPPKSFVSPFLRHTVSPVLQDPKYEKEDQGKTFKFGKMGSKEAEFLSPQDFCLDRDGDIIVADTGNHRIQIFDKNGVFKSQFGDPGTENAQLFYPMKIAAFRSAGCFVICDCFHEKSRLQMFTKGGTFIKRLPSIKGLGIVNGLTVTRNSNIVAVDCTYVFVVARTGEMLLQFKCCQYVDGPSDIVFRGNEFYVTDFRGQSIAIFSNDGAFKRRLERNVRMDWHPSGIDVTEKGVVVVGGSHGNHFHVVVFDPEGRELFAFHCLDYNMWRCGGLKLTPEGYIVTVARYENFVLVMKNIPKKFRNLKS